MNSRLFTIGLICIALVVIRCKNPVSSGGDEPYIVTADQYEPDNYLSAAKTIKADSAAQERTLKRADEDWVVLYATLGKTYKIFTSGNTDTKISIFTSSTATTPIAEADDSQNSMNASVILTATYSTYYIRVSGSDQTSIGAYKLSVLTAVSPDIYEPDSVAAESNLIQNNISQIRTLMPKDVDWVYFYGNSKDTLMVTANGTCRTRMYLYDRDTATLLTSSPSTDSVAKLQYRLPAAGYYFIMITAKDSATEGSYTLSLNAGSVSSIVGADSYENDNTKQTAKTISGSSITQERSLTLLDTDWIKIPVTIGRQYSISFSNSNIRGYIYAKDGTLLQGPYSSLSHNCSATDTIYAKIYSIGASAINYSLYFTVLLQPGTPDQYETDNSMANAKLKCFSTDSLLQDRTITVANSVSDSDWIAFPAQAGKNYTMKTVTTSSTTLYMYLYDKNYSSLKYISSSSNSMTYTPSVSDTLYLLIFRSSTSTSIAYTLSVQGVYVNDSYEPDSCRATAQSISTLSQSRVILPADTDWVIYTATTADSFAILTTGSTDTKLALFSSSGTAPIAENDDIGTNNNNAMVTMKSQFGGQYYIRITGKTALATGTYILQVLSVSNGTLVQIDTFENDNTKQTAVLIKDTNSISQVHSLSLNDTDWIALPVQAGGTYSVTAYSTSNSLSIYGYTSKDSIIDYRTSTTSGTISTMPLKNDTLYFRIFSSYTIARYTLSISRTAPLAPDSYEIDNTKDKAYKATGSFSQTRTITVDDTDWVSIPVLAGGKYTLSSTSSSVRIVLFNSSGVQLSYSTSGSLEFTASSADTFYYLLTSKSPLSYPTIRYTLSMSIVLPLAADSYESDNSLSTAKALLTDSTVQNRTITIGDTDFVSFRVPSAGRVTINAAHTASYYTYLYLYDSLGATLSTKYSTSYGTSLAYTFSTGGLFYCRINSQTSSSYSYSLSAKLAEFDTLKVGNSSSRYLAALDTQWVAISLDSGKSYTIQTTGSTYTRLWLYDSLKATTYRAYDYNSGSDSYTLITYTPIRTGLFFIKITGYTTSTQGNFNLIASDNSTVLPVAGIWEINYNWTSSSSGKTDFTLNENGTFSVNSSTAGTWTLSGNILTMTYSSGTVYTGTVSGQTASGTMTSTTNNGTWTGTKKS